MRYQVVNKLHNTLNISQNGIIQKRENSVKCDRVDVSKNKIIQKNIYELNNFSF